MAIDTSHKRNSALLDPSNMPWPPDGSIVAADRLVMLEFYSGIAAEAVIAPRVTYRPLHAALPPFYNPTASASVPSYRPGSSVPPSTYRPIFQE